MLLIRFYSFEVEFSEVLNSVVNRKSIKCVFINQQALTKNEF